MGIKGPWLPGLGPTHGRAPVPLGGIAPAVSYECKAIKRSRARPFSPRDGNQGPLAPWPRTDPRASSRTPWGDRPSGLLGVKRAIKRSRGKPFSPRDGFETLAPAAGLASPGCPSAHQARACRSNWRQTIRLRPYLRRLPVPGLVLVCNGPLIHRNAAVGLHRTGAAATAHWW